jgi:hypothetical protein
MIAAKQRLERKEKKKKKKKKKKGPHESLLYMFTLKNVDHSPLVFHSK